MNKPALQHARTGERGRSLDIETERLLAATQALMAANAHHVADGIEQLRLKAIVHELPDFLFVKDGESRFVFANAATAKSLGMERASALTGKTDFDLMPSGAGQGILPGRAGNHRHRQAADRYGGCCPFPDRRQAGLSSDLEITVAQRSR